VYPYGCAEFLTGKVKYGCNLGGNCYYADAMEEPNPFAADQCCTSKTDARMLSGGTSEEKATPTGAPQEAC
jgi:hypothetical protein